MTIVAADFWHPSRENLVVGRSQCSSVVDQQDRLLLIGGQNSNSGEIMRWNQYAPNCSSSNRISIPGVSGFSNTTSGSCLVLMRDGPKQKLYQIFRNDTNGHDDLFMADIDHNGLLNNQSNLWSNVIQWVFQNFWKPVAPLETCDVALTSDSERYIYAVGGFVPHYPSGYQMRWLPTGMQMMNNQQVSRNVRRLDTRQKNAMWMEVTALPQGRRDTAAVVVEDYLYVIGGRTSDGKAISSVVRLDLTCNAQWQAIAPMPKGPRYAMAAVALRNRYIVVAGGYGQGKRLRCVECYDTLTNTWSVLPNMLDARMNCSLSFRERSNQLIVGGGTSGWGIVPMQSLETLEIRIVEDNDSTRAHSISELHYQHVVGADTPSSIPSSISELLPVRPPPTAPVVAETLPDPIGVVYADAVVVGEDVVSATRTRSSGHLSVEPSAPTKEDIYHTRYTTPAPPPPPPSSTDNSCAICLERPKTVAFLCGHQVCIECSPLLQECHSCRRPIEGRIRLFD